MSPVITFENVSKHYRLPYALNGGLRNILFHLPTTWKTLNTHRFTALDNISFAIKEGESVGIIGRNGSGKSTMLGLIAGVFPPSSGRIEVKERVSPMLELGGGFHPDLTGRENIILNGVLLGMTRKHIKSRLDEIIEFSELGEFIDQPIRTYSSGMLSRLGFSVITQLDPRLLLIDEVLAVGDERFRRKCYNVIHDFKRNGVTILFVSHSADEVSNLCERAIWIENHRIAMDGKADSVLEAYTQNHG